MAVLKILLALFCVSKGTKLRNITCETEICLIQEDFKHICIQPKHDCFPCLRINCPTVQYLDILCQSLVKCVKKSDTPYSVLFYSSIGLGFGVIIVILTFVFSKHISKYRRRTAVEIEMNEINRVRFCCTCEIEEQSLYIENQNYEEEAENHRSIVQNHIFA